MAISNKSFVLNNGNICPACDTNNVEIDEDMDWQWGTMDIQRTILFPVHCCECGTEWYEEYVLVGYHMK